MFKVGDYVTSIHSSKSTYKVVDTVNLITGKIEVQDIKTKIFYFVDSYALILKTNTQPKSKRAQEADSV